MREKENEREREREVFASEMKISGWDVSMWWDLSICIRLFSFFQHRTITHTRVYVSALSLYPSHTLTFC